jgi:hypothetical protein
MNSKTHIAIAVLAAFCIVPVGAQIVDGMISPDEYDYSQTFDGEAMRVSHTISGDLLYMAVEAETEGWVAVGFDPGAIMNNADMVFGWVVDGTAFSKDCFSIGPTGPHPPDTELGGTSDIAEYAVTEADGRTILEFSRNLSTGDEYDKDISEGMKIIWAYGLTDDEDMYHDRAGYGTLAGGGSGGIGRPLLLTHIFTMSLSLIAFFVGMLIARYGKKKKWWLKTHRGIEMTGSILGFAGIAAGVTMVQLTKGVHLTVPHAWMAVATVVFLIATPAIALIFLKSNISVEAKKKLRPVHRWSGRLAQVLMLATVILGLFQAGIL